MLSPVGHEEDSDESVWTSSMSGIERGSDEPVRVSSRPDIRGVLTDTEWTPSESIFISPRPCRAAGRGEEGTAGAAKIIRRY